MKKFELLQILFEEFRIHGFEGLSLSTISKATGLGKASLYHHFPGGKEQMAVEVMQIVVNWIHEELLNVANSNTPCEVRLESIFKKIDDFYCSGKKNCLLEVMQFQSSSIEIQGLILKSFEQLLESFRKLAQDFNFSKTESKQLAEDVVVSIQGALVVSKGTKNPKLFQRQLVALKNSFKKN